MEQIKKIVRGNTDAMGIFVFMVCVFSYIMFVIKWQSDLCAHAHIAQQMLNEHRLFSSNFLMYFLINLFSLFTGYRYPMRAVLVVIIAIANTAKYVIVREAFKEWVSHRIAKLASCSMLFVYVIPWLFFLRLWDSPFASDNMYLGYYVPNVWHNSTILCMMPFAIACYLLSVKQFDEYSSRRNWYITLLLGLSVLVKPSFYFIYVFSYPIIIWSKYRFKKVFFQSLIPLLLGGIFLVYEYFTIYYYGVNDDSSVVINVIPLFTLDFWRSHLLNFVLSMTLPLLFICLYGNIIFHDREFWFVFLMLVFGIGMMWSFRETGPRATHGNFGWQVIAAMWFVYYYILKTIVLRWKHTESAKMDRTQLVAFLAIGIHVIMGFVYLGRIFIMNNIW